MPGLTARGAKNVTRALIEATARVAELEAALRPFAVLAGSYGNDEPAARVVVSKLGAIVSIGDLRRAAQLVGRI